MPKVKRVLPREHVARPAVQVKRNLNLSPLLAVRPAVPGKNDFSLKQFYGSGMGWTKRKVLYRSLFVEFSI